jgi:adenine-specific DNA methylase
MIPRESYPKRLIEVDLPIKRISAHARREKSIRHGHISTLHIWWARRPLAACRSVICAALWPDPADERCPSEFVNVAREEMLAWTSHERQILLSEESRKRFEPARRNRALFDDPKELRAALFDFISDFANWDSSTVGEYLDTSRTLTRAAHESLGGIAGTRPILVDPFAGGGSIPLEGLRVGADAFASDLNPVPVLLNKVVLEYVPRYGERLAVDVRKWGKWIKEEAEKELADLYPKDADGAAPLAYLWARTIQCEGPACGAEIPLVRSFLLGKREGKATGLRLKISQSSRSITYSIAKASSPESFEHGTLRRGSATCPICGYTVPGLRVRQQASEKHGGADSARLLAVYCDSSTGRFYRSPNAQDLAAFAKARALVERQRTLTLGEGTTIIPDEELPYLRSIFNINLIGVTRWEQMFSARQLATLLTLAKLVRRVFEKIKSDDPEFAIAVATTLAFGVDRQADYSSSICTWVQSGEFVGHTFAQGQSLPIKWDFAEVAPFASGSGNWDGAIGWITRVLDEVAAARSSEGNVQLASATSQPLPDDSAQLIFTDPPYYDAIPYADLSDFFYVWLKRTVGTLHPQLFQEKTTQKDGEIVQLAERNSKYAYKTREYFEQLMGQALGESRRVASPSGLAVIVFAHKETSAWESMIQAVISAGWIVVASWPIDTEMGARLRARNSAVLASSIHLVCRPRENLDGSVRTNDIGDWRDILQELPKRIHEWMPRLALEGVVGADAIFACLGPALEIFSQHSRVEKASGETVLLSEYLENVWAAVSKEALAMIFVGGDATGFEEDARLTAMWLWTLSTANSSNVEDDAHNSAAEEEADGITSKFRGYALEYDAARKIAQGLGAHLEQLSSLIEVGGPIARLLPVAERARTLFEGGDSPSVIGRGKTKAKPEQIPLGFVADLEKVAKKEGWGETGAPRLGQTVLDRVHQSMILFGAGRGDALKRFLIDDGVGRDDRFWRLAQALSSLYPSLTDEKRWVDGVLARKKGLGF